MPAVRGALLAHVQTWRPYTLWYVGLLGVAGAGLGGAGLGGAGLGGGGLGWPGLLAAWAAPTIGWIGGHYLGDFFDRRLDAISKPHRPIPSGRLRAGTALACGVTCLVAVAVLAAAGGWATTAIAALAVGGIVGYGGWLKGRGLAGNLVRGALGALVLLYGAAAAGGAAGGWTLAAFALAFWAHDTASNLVGALRDEDGDRAGGYRTVPVRRGGRPAARAAAMFYGAAVVVAVAGAAAWPGTAAGADAGAGRLAGVLAALAASAAVGASALLTVLPPRPGPPPAARTALRAHELLVLERIGFTGAVIGLGLGLATALALSWPALMITWWAQARMRAGHEFGPREVAREVAREAPRPAAGTRDGLARPPTRPELG